MPETFRLAKTFLAAARREGAVAALKKAARRWSLDPNELLPLSRVNRAGLFARDIEEIHAEERRQIRSTSLIFDASQVEATYPNVFERNGRFLRYGFLPAQGQSQGLVVLFHGHNAFLHMGPVRPWQSFDLLAPWDTFGWNRQGSWFWGEKGDPFVAALMQELIAKHRKPDEPLFTIGSSMGGFGALFHGLQAKARGIYVMCPQIDLAAKIEDFGADEPTNPYRYLKGVDDSSLPDLVAMAGQCEQLPSLFLIQNQYDHINPFADHAWKLLEIYNRRSGWYGLRIHPSLGHGGDGKQDEAELFFKMILDKDPPVQAPRKARFATGS